MRRRLVVRLFGVLAVLAAGLFLFLDAYARRAADAAFDRLLLASALSIADTVQVQDGRFAVDLPYSALGILAQARRDRVFYRVTAPDGGLITGYADLPVKAAPAGLRPGDGTTQRFHDATYRGMPVRVAVLNRFAAQPDTSGWVTIAVAQTREERGALASDILANAFFAIVFAVVAAGALIWFGVQRALAPLAALEQVIRARQPHDFSPIVLPPPKEVSQLVHAINQVMVRLKGNLDTMQTFLADAAHQIRTPLASLRLQAELAAEEDDPARLRRIAQRVHRNAVEASHLTSQLLNHAMVMHRREALEPEAVDLAALLEQVVQRAQVVAEDTPVRLTLPADAVPPVPGDAISLREALANLVDNAVKYAGAFGPVDVVLLSAADGAGPVVRVADRGPGIPDDDKPRVLERFRRGDSAAGVAGSGLGLSIVRSVAEAHGASLILADRPGGGLAVCIGFPAVAAPASPSRRPAVAVLLAAGLLLAGVPGAWAQEHRFYPAPGGEGARLRIHSATDRAAIEPLIRDFQSIRPEIAIDYVTLENQQLYDRALEDAARPGGDRPDLLISSAPDLQVKLVNDGLTQPHRPAVGPPLPAWANWRNEAFGFTFEPVVMVYNRALLSESEAPQTRDALIRLLRGDPARFLRRVATYDAASSGIGALLAAQDAALFSQFWQLTAALGGVQVRLTCCSGDILDMVERGEVLIGYNVLGSYARARAAAGTSIGIVTPRDYTLVVSRVAVIPATARTPQLAGQFIDYLLSYRGQDMVAGGSTLYALAPTVTREASSTGLRAVTDAPLHPIALGPALLAFLDPLKHQRFVRQWQSAVLPP
ncbi:two-component system sensor histidine kinase TctE [Azospirillum fermentarium]|uniref:sensor histidine kinase n=1 Tax=Azospirillum fermentarium TaxID=1233114 RepID=UPI002226D6E3|nr:extracellular solute-binding protein [Azospirillum fermentarium]MCW2247680.1 two-component system sensor histidine kinase TctE [Azospirillum fermentarium]